MTETKGIKPISQETTVDLQTKAGGGFRKPKGKPKHADSTVAVLGTWKSDKHEADFLNRVVSVYANMTDEYHLHATTCEDVLTVAAKEKKFVQTGETKRLTFKATFTHYRWVIMNDPDTLKPNPVTGYWAIVTREQLL